MSGIGNVVGLQNLQTEYKDLNQIRADKSILQDYGTVNEIGQLYNYQENSTQDNTGFAVKVGDNTLYRLKNSNFYKGLPDNMPQNVAKTIEALITKQDPRDFKNGGGDLGSQTVQNC